MCTQLRYDGYSYIDYGEAWDLGFPFGTVSYLYMWDGVSFTWWFFAGPELFLLPLTALMFVQSWRKSAARTRQMETNRKEETLTERLQDGSIRLLSVSWLLKHGPDFPDGKLPRRQELEDKKGALIEPSAAVGLLRANRVGALSYKWLDRNHPDPKAHHLNAILAFFRKFPFSFSRRRPVAMFWDYASLHQNDKEGGNPRTGKEEEHFQNALSVMTNMVCPCGPEPATHHARPGLRVV